MKIINNQIALSDLATELGVTNQSLLYHLKNQSGLGEGAIKLKQTSVHLLQIDSVLNYLNWLLKHKKQVKLQTILHVQERINEQISNN